MTRLLPIEVGQTFGEWTTIRLLPPVPKGKRPWLCRCSCGYEGQVLGPSLVSGRSRSCGHKVKVGDRFSELEVVAEDGRNKHGAVMWVCLCSCGKTSRVQSGSLTSGNTKSCGHLSPVQKKHGGKTDVEYHVWSTINQRCCNPKHHKYSNYGGRGITFCDRWKADYAAFLRDMGRRPFPGAQIDRIDNNKGYEPGNCRWVTPTQNARNRRSSRFLTASNGDRRTLAEWSEVLGVSAFVISSRIKRGMSEADALAYGARNSTVQNTGELEL